MSLEEKLTNVADAVRYVLGTNSKYTMTQIASLITELSSGVETADVVKTITEFDISKYGISLYNLFGGFIYPQTAQLIAPENQIMYNNYVVSFDYNKMCNVYFMPFNVATLFPKGTFTSTYADISNQNVYLETYEVLQIVNCPVTTISFNNLTISQKYSFRYEDSSKSYTTGLAFIGNKNGAYLNGYYDHRSSAVNSRANQIIKLSFIDIKNDKLYMTNGNTETEICSLEPNVDYNIEYTGVYTEDSTVSTDLTYTFKVNNTTYSDDISFTSTDSIFSVSAKTTNFLAYSIRENCPEMMRWYSNKITSLMETNILQNYYTNYSNLKLFELNDTAIPGATKIGNSKFNIGSFPYFEKINISVTEIGDKAFIQSISSLSTLGNQLKTINLPNVKTIGNQAFYDESSYYKQFYDNAGKCFQPHVIDINMPNVESIGSGAFQYKLYACHKDLTLNKLTSLGNDAFNFSGLTSFSSTSLTSIPAYCFRNSAMLHTITLPNVTRVYQYAFDGCSNLVNINLPECTRIDNNTFGNIVCRPIHLNAPKLQYIGGMAFYQANFFGETLSLPSVTTIESVNSFDGIYVKRIELNSLVYYSRYTSLFGAVQYIESFYCPLLISSVDNAGKGMLKGFCRTHIRELNLDTSCPSLTYYSGEMFNNCNIPIIKSSLLTNPIGDCVRLFKESPCINQVWMYNMPTIGIETFQKDWTLEFAYFGKLTTIAGANNFTECHNLQALILESDIICTLAGASINCAFNPHSSWVEDRGGYIYVPEDLIEDYKVASNWSNYATRFRAIEDYGGVQGIYKLIYPEFDYTETITQTSLFNQMSNGTLYKGATLTKSNSFNGFVLEDFEGDTNQYVFHDGFSTTNITNFRSFLDLPSCKDFQLEFDCVFFANCYFNIEFGWDQKLLTSSDVENLSPCSTVYIYSINAGSIRKGVLATGLFSSVLTDQINIPSPTTDYNANASRIYYARVKSELNASYYSRSDGFNYFRQKLHIKLIRKGKEFKSYMNDILVHRYIDSNLETDAGGYFAISKTAISNNNLSAKFGIANVILKHN